MQILVNSDHHIHGSEDLTGRIQGVVEGELEPFGDRITRVEVHLSDLSSHSVGDRDKRCLMEARIAGFQPIAVSHEAPTLAEAIHEAANKLPRAIGRVLGRMKHAPGRAPPQDHIAAVDELNQLDDPQAHRP